MSVPVFGFFPPSAATKVLNERALPHAAATTARHERGYALSPEFVQRPHQILSAEKLMHLCFLTPPVYHIHSFQVKANPHLFHFRLNR